MPCRHDKERSFFALRDGVVDAVLHITRAFPRNQSLMQKCFALSDFLLAHVDVHCPEEQMHDKAVLAPGQFLGGFLAIMDANNDASNDLLGSFCLYVQTCIFAGALVSMDHFEQLSGHFVNIMSNHQDSAVALDAQSKLFMLLFAQHSAFVISSLIISYKRWWLHI